MEFSDLFMYVLYCQHYAILGCSLDVAHLNLRRAKEVSDSAAEGLSQGNTHMEVMCVCPHPEVLKLAGV